MEWSSAGGEGRAGSNTIDDNVSYSLAQCNSNEWMEKEEEAEEVVVVNVSLLMVVISFFFIMSSPFSAPEDASRLAS
jgi:hypothetical protein